MIVVLGFDSHRRLEIFLLAATSRQALVPTQPPIQWIPKAFPRGWSGRGVKPTRMRGAIPLFPQYVFMVWCLVKHRDNFTFTSTFILKYLGTYSLLFYSLDSSSVLPFLCIILCFAETHILLRSSMPNFLHSCTFHTPKTKCWKLVLGKTSVKLAKCLLLSAIRWQTRAFKQQYDD
jgi:hypothetical protein